MEHVRGGFTKILGDEASARRLVRSFAPGDDLKHVVGQRPLKVLCLLPRR